jgi:hypothetical protein
MEGAGCEFVDMVLAGGFFDQSSFDDLAKSRAE